MIRSLTKLLMVVAVLVPSFAHATPKATPEQTNVAKQLRSLISSAPKGSELYGVSKSGVKASSIKITNQTGALGPDRGPSFNFSVTGLSKAGSALGGRDRFFERVDVKGRYSDGFAGPMYKVDSVRTEAQK